MDSRTHKINRKNKKQRKNYFIAKKISHQLIQQTDAVTEDKETQSKNIQDMIELNELEHSKDDINIVGTNNIETLEETFSQSVEDHYDTSIKSNDQSTELSSDTATVNQPDNTCEHESEFTSEEHNDSDVFGDPQLIGETDFVPIDDSKPSYYNFYIPVIGASLVSGLLIMCYCAMKR